MLPFKLAAPNVLRNIKQQQGKGILHLIDLFFQIEQRCTDIIIGSFGLRQPCFGHHTGCFHSTGGSHTLRPGSLGGCRYFKLGIEHQQGIIIVGNGRHQLGLHRLFILPTLRKNRLCTALGVGDTSEEINLPACRNGQCVRLRSFRTIKTTHRALWRKRERRQIG